MVVGASVLFWASRDYTVVAPDWDGQVRGIAYNPSHLFSPTRQTSMSRRSRSTATWPSFPQITGHIRTYTVDGGMDKVPEIARRYGMTVSLGIWIGPDLDKNEQEIELGIKTALANRRIIDRVIVGNETQHARRCLARPAQRLYPAGARRAARSASRSPPPSPGRPGC